jgi:hypothetical protein
VASNNSLPESVQIHQQFDDKIKEAEIVPLHRFDLILGPSNIS